MPRTSLALIAVTTFALGLAGCAPTAEIAEPPVVTPTQTPTPSATPEEPVVAEIVIGSDAITLSDSEGEPLGEYSYFDESASPAIAAINDALDADVEGVFTDGGNHASYNLYEWGGLTIREFEADAEYPETFVFNTYAEAAEINGVQIAATGGIQVGWAGADVAPLSFEDNIDTGGTSDIHFYGVDRVLVDVPFQTYGPARLSVGIWASVPDEVVYRIQAPGQNWGH